MLVVDCVNQITSALDEVLIEYEPPENAKTEIKQADLGLYRSSLGH